MVYRAVANPSLYHCGYRWVVVDVNYNTESRHHTRDDAERAAERLNKIKAE
ncbi:hypothetical protein EV210_101182 [Anaerospora hongkongensis]|uniref:Uncharacterized protein n=1 Tax=Anaerospora hongkongensis TaxID=244830 RepID=A0A4R1Q4N9_9FIRM|nr:hypothetical protein [Anaerospora hongkongensis]TCL39982.1 hypothetical protein EV210_101182 [Anaerospora hongkongensis]